MGLLSSSTLFGRPGGVSGRAKKAAWDVYGQYGNTGNWYNPQTDQALMMEDFDRQRGMGQAAGYGRLAGAGYRPNSGVDYMALARALYAGQAGAKARQQALDWRWRLLQGQAGLLPLLTQQNMTQPSGGLLGNLVSLGGTAGLRGLF